jgi:hypothetical protein
MSKLIPITMHDKLRKLTYQLDRRLIKLEKNLFKIQKQLLRFKKELPTTTTTQAISQMEKLRASIVSERQSLQVLQRAKPGFAAAIIDFIYNWTVKPIPSQKEQYFEQLKKLDDLSNKEILEDRLSLSPSITKKVADAFYSQYRSSLKEFNDAIFRRLLGSLESSNKEVGSLYQLLLDGFKNKELARKAMFNIVRWMEKLTTEQNPQAQMGLTSRFNEIRQFLNAGTKIASSENAIELVQAMQAQIQSSIEDNNKLKERLEEITSKVGLLSSTFMSRNDIALIQKYQGYIEALLSPSGSGLQSQLLQLRRTLDSLEREAVGHQIKDETAQNFSESTTETE